MVLSNPEMVVIQPNLEPKYMMAFCAVPTSKPFSFYVTHSSAEKDLRFLYDIWQIGFLSDRVNLDLTHKVSPTGSTSYFFDKLSHDTNLVVNFFPCKSLPMILVPVYANQTAYMIRELNRL